MGGRTAEAAVTHTGLMAALLQLYPAELYVDASVGISSVHSGDSSAVGERAFEVELV